MVKKKRHKLTVELGCAALIASLLSGCSAANQGQSSREKTSVSGVMQYDRNNVVMGTLTKAVIYSSGKDRTKEVMERLSQVENDAISWRVEGSDIDKLNKSAGHPSGVEVSEDTAFYLEKTLELAQNTDGAFDPTMGKISRLWDVDGDHPQVPEKEELKQLLDESGYEKIQQDGTHVVLESGASVDFGAVGKGIGCDEAKKLLESDSDVCGAVISVGGSILTYGTKPDESDWKVAITNPDNDTDYVGILTLSGENYVSTSGSYEKFFEQDGNTYHHIMDPATGYPAESGLVSVSVLTDNGLLSDGLSTACFVLGKEKSLPVLEKYEADAIFIDENHKVYVTDGIKNKFELVREGYELAEE